MKRPKEQLSSLDLWEIISKEYVGTHDICKIAYVGVSTAQEIRKEIEKECADWMLPKYHIPTELLLTKLKMNKNDIYKKAKMEMELKGARL